MPDFLKAILLGIISLFPVSIAIFVALLLNIVIHPSDLIAQLLLFLLEVIILMIGGFITGVLIASLEDKW